MAWGFRLFVAVRAIVTSSGYFEMTKLKTAQFVQCSGGGIQESLDSKNTRKFDVGDENIAERHAVTLGSNMMR